MALDGDSGLYPLAFAVVESECTNSWKFFLHCLHTIIGDTCNYKPWTFMSDGQKVQFSPLAFVIVESEF